MSDAVPTVAEMVAPKFLGAEGLDGAEETVTITRIRRSQEVFDAGKKDTVNVFSIRRVDGRTADVLFCRTNVYACRLLFGDDPNKWIGKRLVLMIDQDLYAKELVPCIRISGSPDAAAGRSKLYTEAFNHPEGRPRKLIGRLKAIVRKAAAQKASAPASAQTPPAVAQPPAASPPPPAEVVNQVTGEVTTAPKPPTSQPPADDDDDDAPSLS